MSQVYKDIVDNYPDVIVFCDLNHNITYMNKAAIKRYAHRGGSDLIGRSIFACHNENSKELVLKYLDKIIKEDLYEIYMYYNKKDKKEMFLTSVRDENGKVIGYFERHGAKEIEE